MSNATFSYLVAASASLPRRSRDYVPGLALLFAAITMTLVSSPLLATWRLSPLNLAILGGILIGNTIYQRFNTSCSAGVDLPKARLQRLEFILYGFRIGFQDIAQIRWPGLLTARAVLTTTFLLTVYLSRPDHTWIRKA